MCFRRYYSLCKLLYFPSQTFFQFLYRPYVQLTERKTQKFTIRAAKRAKRNVSGKEEVMVTRQGMPEGNRSSYYCQVKIRE